MIHNNKGKQSSDWEKRELRFSLFYFHINKFMENFIGQDGFVWFTGVVEDRQDPDKLGRVRVRCVGYHTDNISKIPTADLPWAWVMMPTTSSSMNGLGQTPPFIVEGTWVIGFFRDADTLQEPVVMGTLPGVPSEFQKVDKGFYDPRNEESTQSDEKYKFKPDYGPYPIRTSDSDINRLAKNDSNNIHPEIKTRDTAAVKDIPIANVDTTWNELKTTDETTRGKTASGTNPETNESRTVPYKRRNSEYPYNHVYETESGHVKEFDDTPFAERIYEKHRTGTFYEVDADGNKVTRVVGNNYDIIAGSNFVNIKGDVNLTIDSNCNTYIKGNWEVQVDGNKNEIVKGTYNQEVTGTVTETYKDTMTQNVTGNVTETYSGNQTTKVTGNVDIDGARIDLN